VSRYTSGSHLPGRVGDHGRMRTRERLAVVILLEDANTTVVEEFRSRWDPLAGRIPAHITLVFPFEPAGDWRVVQASVAAVAARHGRFGVSLADPIVHKDEYLFLVPRAGAREITELHTHLYRALPAAVKLGPFAPHMTIGRDGDGSRTQAALREAQDSGLTVNGVARTLSVYRIDAPGPLEIVFAEPLGAELPGGSHEDILLGGAG
jgi:2'-5' RNA ligase